MRKVLKLAIALMCSVMLCPVFSSSAFADSAIAVKGEDEALMSLRANINLGDVCSNVYEAVLSKGVNCWPAVSNSDGNILNQTIAAETPSKINDDAEEEASEETPAENRESLFLDVSKVSPPLIALAALAASCVLPVLVFVTRKLTER